MILAIDPGTERSAFVIFDGAGLQAHDWLANADLLPLVHSHAADGNPVACEMVASYGMAVGQTTFETCLWVGRFIEAAGGRCDLLYRKKEDAYPAICMHLCHSTKAKDGNIRQALLDRFPKTGGGKVPQVGTKKQPGPLYGVSSHVWSALAVAVVWWDVTQARKNAA